MLRCGLEARGSRSVANERGDHPFGIHYIRRRHYKFNTCEWRGEYTLRGRANEDVQTTQCANKTSILGYRPQSRYLRVRATSHDVDQRDFDVWRVHLGYSGCKH